MSRLDRMIDQARSPSSPQLVREVQEDDVVDAPIRLMEQSLQEMTAGEALELADRNPDSYESKALRRALRGMLPTQKISLTREHMLAIADNKSVVLVTEPKVVGGEMCEVTRRDVQDRQEARKMERIGVEEAEEKARKKFAENNPAYSDRMASQAAAPIDTSKSESPDIEKTEQVRSPTQARKEAAKADKPDKLDTQNDSKR